MWAICSVRVRPRAVTSFMEGSLVSVWAFTSATAKIV